MNLFILQNQELNISCDPKPGALQENVNEEILGSV